MKNLKPLFLLLGAICLLLGIYSVTKYKLALGILLMTSGGWIGVLYLTRVGEKIRNRRTPSREAAEAELTKEGNSDLPAKSEGSPSDIEEKPKTEFECRLDEALLKELTGSR